MRLPSYLVQSRHGIYYLRIQRGGTDRRVSLRTRDPQRAMVAAYTLGATLLGMKRISTYDITVGPDGLRIKADGEDDHRRAMEAVERARDYYAALAASAMSKATAAKSSWSPPSLHTVYLRDALREYLPVLQKSDMALKSKKMAESTLGKMAEVLGGDFDMASFVDAEIEVRWLEPRKHEVAAATVKKELSWVRAFASWAAEPSRKYCPAQLSLTVAAENEHYDYYRSDDLRRIFNALPDAAARPWHLWVPVIALYTGARVGEPAALKVDHFGEKVGLKIMHLPGTKTDCAPRDVPIHPDLLSMGLLDLVAARRDAGCEFLFDISVSAQNGAGAAPSKWYTNFLREVVGIKDEKKVFHSFRHTLIDHLRQHDAPREAREQYVGHSQGSSAHAMYGRELLGLPALQERVVDKINWQRYCGWQPDIEKIRATSAALIKENSRMA